MRMMRMGILRCNKIPGNVAVYARASTDDKAL
jgi:hypothetical protein